VTDNGLRLAAGGAFQHYRSFGKPYFNYKKKLSTEALHPRLHKTAVLVAQLVPYIRELTKNSS
jgi:hypothetical protein